LVDDLLGRYRCLGVQDLRVVQQIQRGQEGIQAALDFARPAGELGFDAAAFVLECGHTFGELLVGPGRIAHQVEVVIFFGADLLELALELVAQAAVSGAALTGGLAHYLCGTLPKVLG